MRSMKEYPKGSPEREKLSKIANQWHEEYANELDKIVADQDLNMDRLIETIWRQGILDHVAPTDPEVIDARQKLGRSLWATDRNDTKLYWRLGYSAATLKHAVENHYTVAGGPVATAIMPAYARTAGAQKLKTLFPNYEEEEPSITMANSILNKVRNELESRGQKFHETLIPIGARGVYEGIPVKVDGYTSKGKIYLVGQDIKSHMQLFDIKAGDGVDPDLLDPKDFHLEK